MSNVQPFDFYEILGVERNASAQEVERAYQKLVARFGSEKSILDEVSPRERMDLIEEAYRTLSNQNLRAAYQSPDGEAPPKKPGLARKLRDPSAYPPAADPGTSVKRKNVYRDYYGFSDKPFDLTPDPKYLYLSPKHKEVLAHLVYGMQENNGFLKIVGEVGTGKTTLCRSFLKSLHTDFNIAYIFNPWVDALELLQSIVKELGLPWKGLSKKQLIESLNDLLLKERKKGHRVVVIIDEAQDLDPAVLEQLRLISNLETETEKLIQIVLIGQPELDELLQRPELRQLRQRITIQWELLPLNRDETHSYLHHRLNIALGRGKVHFTQASIDRIYKYSKGIPRMINVLADRTLLIAYTQNTKRITPRMVAQAARDVGGLVSKENGLGPLLKIALPLMILWGGLFWLIDSLPISKWWGKESPQPVVQKQTPPQPAPTPALPAPTDAVKPKDTLLKDLESPIFQDGTAPLDAQADAVQSDPVSGQPASPDKGPLMFSEPDTLITYLSSLEHTQSKLEAAKWIFKAWGIPLEPSASLDEPTLLNLEEEFQILRHEFTGDLNRLIDFNYPALLEINLPHSQGTKYVSLLSINDKIGVFGSVDSIEIPLPLIDSLWNRRAIIFWKDFEELPPDFERGFRGKEAIWLQKNLRLLGFFQGREAPVYGGKTTQAVIQFQRQHGIRDDGKFDLESRLMLYSLLNIYTTPRLQNP